MNTQNWWEMHVTKNNTKSIELQYASINALSLYCSAWTRILPRDTPSGLWGLGGSSSCCPCTESTRLRSNGISAPAQRKRLSGSLKEKKETYFQWKCFKVSWVWHLLPWLRVSNRQGGSLKSPVVLRLSASEKRCTRRFIHTKVH